LFYEMSNDSKFKDVKYAKGTDWEGIVCPKNDGHRRAGNRIGQLKIEIKTKKIGDFLNTFLSEWLISDKVAEIFNDCGFTGYELKPVSVCNMELPHKLWEFVVCGKGGGSNPASGIYLKSECPYCHHKVYSAFENGIIVDENNWDGSDFFTITGYRRYILVTERVKNVVEENQLKGVKFIPSHELIWPSGVIKP